MNPTAILAVTGWYLAAVLGAYAVLYRRRWLREKRRRLLGPADLLESFSAGLGAVVGAAAVDRFGRDR